MRRGERERKERKKKENRKKQSCPIFLTVFRRLEFGSPRIKVGLLYKSYEQVSRTKGFGTSRYKR